MTIKTTEIKQFKPGEKYSCRSICDHNCIWTFKIIKRTIKSVWIKDIFNGETVRKQISVYDGSEIISPLGKYSMSPTLRAKKIVNK